MQPVPVCVYLPLFLFAPSFIRCFLSAAPSVCCPPLSFVWPHSGCRRRKLAGFLALMKSKPVLHRCRCAGLLKLLHFKGVCTENPSREKFKALIKDLINLLMDLRLSFVPTEGQMKHWLHKRQVSSEYQCGTQSRKRLRSCHLGCFIIFFVSPFALDVRPSRRTPGFRKLLRESERLCCQDTFSLLHSDAAQNRHRVCPESTNKIGS